VSRRVDAELFCRHCGETVTCDALGVWYARGRLFDDGLDDEDCVDSGTGAHEVGLPVDDDVIEGEFREVKR
jgi:hypothetical protein